MNDAQQSDTSLRVTLLGSGSPSPSLARCHPAVLVEWGDTAKVLVDACAAPPPPDAPPARQQLIARLHEFHASPQECVDMAAAAGVGHVVLTHHLPEGAPTVDASGFDGRISIGSDLDRYTTEPVER